MHFPLRRVVLRNKTGVPEIPSCFCGRGGGVLRLAGRRGRALHPCRADGAGNIKLVAGHGQAANAAAGLQRAQILGPKRRRGDVAAGIFGNDRFAILRAGDIQAAVAAEGCGADLVRAGGAELIFGENLALVVQGNKIRVAGAALTNLARAYHTAGNTAADCDIAACVDADSVGLVRSQGGNLFYTALRALTVIERDKGIVVAGADRRRRHIGGGRAGDRNAARRVERHAEAGGRAGAAYQILPRHIAGGIILGEINPNVSPNS